MKIRKVSPEIFDRIKYLGSIGSVGDVSSQTGLCKTTINKIVYHCDNYQDYLDYLQESKESLTKRIKEANLAQLSGEPLFWKIHSDLRNISAKRICEHTGLSYDMVRKMKESEDYENFLNGERRKTMPTRIKITPEVYKEIKTSLVEGNPLKEVANRYEVALITVRRIKGSTSYKNYKEKVNPKLRKNPTPLIQKGFVGESKLTGISEAKKVAEPETGELETNIHNEELLAVIKEISDKKFDNQRLKYKGIFLLIGIALVWAMLLATYMVLK